MTTRKGTRKPRNLDAEVSKLKLELDALTQNRNLQHEKWSAEYDRRIAVQKEGERAIEVAREAEKRADAERELRQQAETRAARAEGYAEALLIKAFPATPTPPWREPRVDQWGNRIFP